MATNPQVVNYGPPPVQNVLTTLRSIVIEQVDYLILRLRLYRVMFEPTYSFLGGRSMWMNHASPTIDWPTAPSNYDGYFLAIESSPHPTVLCLTQSEAGALGRVMGATQATRIEANVDAITGVVGFSAYRARNIQIVPHIDPDLAAKVQIQFEASIARCECGGHKAGYADFAVGHSNWCDVAMKR